MILINTDKLVFYNPELLEGAVEEKRNSKRRSKKMIGDRDNE